MATAEGLERSRHARWKHGAREGLLMVSALLGVIGVIPIVLAPAKPSVERVSVVVLYALRFGGFWPNKNAADMTRPRVKYR
jgi:hypothetical protein